MTMEFRDTDRVALKFNKVQLTGSLNRLVQLAKFDPDAEYLDTFMIEVPHGKLLFAAHKITFRYMMSLGGNQIAYHLYRPSPAPTQHAIDAIVDYLERSKVAKQLHIIENSRSRFAW
jgi:CO dehydrogenase/acetyl-CoA synthase delta subunit